MLRKETLFNNLISLNVMQSKFEAAIGINGYCKDLIKKGKNTFLPLSANTTFFVQFKLGVGFFAYPIKFPVRSPRLFSPSSFCLPPESPISF